jgi:hypothetical protein
VVVALGLIICSAGAAVGTVLSGDISGHMPFSLSQALVVDGGAFSSEDITYGDGTGTPRSIGATHDSSTAFQAAAEIAVGDKYIISLPLRNNSNAPIVGLITIDRASLDGIEVDIDEHSILPITLVTSEDAAARGAPLTVGTHTYNTRYWPLADNDDDGDVDAGDVAMIVTGAGASVTVDSVNSLLGIVTYTISGAPAASLTIDYRYGSEITVLAQVGPNQWKFKADSTLGDNRSGDIEIIVAHGDSAGPGFYRITGTIEQISW